MQRWLSWHLKMPSLLLLLFFVCGCLRAPAELDVGDTWDEQAARLLIPRPPSDCNDDLSDVEMECVSSFNWNAGSPNAYVYAPVANPVNPNSICAGGYATHGTHLTMYGDVQPRMFFKRTCGGVLETDVRNSSVSWWMDLSALGAGYNGALYTTWTEHHRNARMAAQRYCDANNGVGNGLWCPEMDLVEANACGFVTSSHPCIRGTNWPIYCSMDAGSAFPGYCGQYCNRAGQGAQTEFDDFGPDADRIIDTRDKFHVEVKFAAKHGNFVSFTVTLTQGNKSWSKFQTNPYQEYPHGFPEKMALMAQLWNTSTVSAMEWLAGPNCTHSSNPNPSEVVVKIWDISIDGKVIKFKKVTRDMHSQAGSAETPDVARRSFRR